MSIIATMCEAVAVSLLRAGIGQDTSGGTTQSYAPVIGWPAVGMPCSASEPGASPGVFYSQRDYECAVELWFPSGNPGVQINNVILVKDVRSNTTYSYNVQGLAQPVYRGRLWKVQVQFISKPPVT